MLFFTDALDGRTVTTTPTDASVVLDKNIRTAKTTATGTANQVIISWGMVATDYDAVALMLSDASDYTITPNGETPITASLTPSKQQSVYRETEIEDGEQITVILTAGGSIQEVFILKEAIRIGNSDRPTRYMKSIAQGQPSQLGYDPMRHYRTQDESLISYAPLAPRGKSYFQIEFTFASKSLIDKFEQLWLGPPIKKPFYIYPEPAQRPNEVFRVYYANDFAPRPSAASITSGYTLEMLLMET